MKLNVTRKEPVPDFAPITMEITIESAQELHAWLALSRHNSRTAEAATGSGYSRHTSEAVIRNVIGNLYSPLSDILERLPK